MGYDEKDIADPSDMEKYYSKEEQQKYGVLGIKIKKYLKQKNYQEIGKRIEINVKGCDKNGQ